MNKLAIATAVSALLGATGAHALSVTATSDTNTLLSALGTAGLNNISNATTTGAAGQIGTYTGFSTVGTGNLADGIVLSSGYADQVPLSNTEASWDHNDIGAVAPEDAAGGSTDDADLVAILQADGNLQGVNDVAFLSFDFEVDSGTTSVSASFVFGTDEYPDQSVTDIFAFIVDGVNYAFFSDGSLINFDVDGPNAAFYQDNATNTSNVFNIEWDGLTSILNVTGLLDTSKTTHNLKIAIADTSDRIFDSAVYITGLSAGTATGGGINPPDPDAYIPVPAGLPLLLGGLGALALARRRKSAA